MGLRFRRSLKLAPGIRLNFSGSGISLSAGPRGAKVNFGQRGTYFSTGIPGTGIYSRTRIDENTSRRHSAPAPQKVRVNVTISVEEDGTLTFKNADGKPVNEYAVTMAKRQHGDDIHGLLEDVCEKQNAPGRALAEIHLHTPDPAARVQFTPREFEEPAPKQPIAKTPGFLGGLFKSRAERIAEENRQAQLRHQVDLAAWQGRMSAFEVEEADRKDFLERRVLTDPAAMEQHLTNAFEDITWPRETSVAFEIVGDGKTAALDVDLPEIEDMPKRTASVPARGYKLNFKPLSAGQIQKMYAAHVHGVGFRLIGEVFALLPSVTTVVLSAYTQRPSTATGAVSNEYLYSVRATRDAWSRIRFDKLAALDVVEALAQFQLRRDITKAGRLNAVEPFVPEPEVAN